MADSGDRLGENPLRKLRLYLYLVPVLGAGPALWQLYRRSGDRREQRVARQGVTLMFSWLVLYLSLGWGGEHLADVGNFRLLFLNTLLTSGYFLSCFFLMLQVWRKTGNTEPLNPDVMPENIPPSSH
ncbi:hypothetical protein NIES970_21020 [[Synechococcus] sp. NIES-970]|uniref:hypothetical protein n=1 Tax=Picosynechococcus sp. NKBG15041c TaxID=1407650 RepID=UPI00040E281D|nr:hypothetical protein [Picosynechococcus sp. NKBG15041c]BAW97156.1 hypothetical protein NIES970_21020 [[Synechococcus] sp. NIES-970]